MTIGIVAYANHAVLEAWRYDCSTEACWAQVGRPAAEWVIVPGADVYKNGTLSDAMADRMQMAIQLHDNGFVKKILISHGQTDGEDWQADAMKAYAVNLGVPAGDITVDYEGYSTDDTMRRAHEEYGITKAVVTTQAYHLPRALYLAAKYGIEPIGRVADAHIYAKAAYFAVREWAARTKAFFR